MEGEKPELATNIQLLFLLFPENEILCILVIPITILNLAYDFWMLWVLPRSVWKKIHRFDGASLTAKVITGQPYKFVAKHMPDGFF
ncbi:MAG: hypothetical protein U5L00_02060 [Desulfovermiculus sp.]|nr:hypothetical protein [Desulfovermiculus sp.]